MTKTIRFHVLLFIGIFGFMTACNVLPQSVSFTITDALGRAVSFDRLPERIVIAGRANFMLNNTVYMFPDAPGKIIALTKANQAAAPFVSLLDPQAMDKLVLTFDAGADEIAARNPDVVLMKGMMKSQGDALEQLGIPVVYLDFEDPHQYQRDLAVLGTLFGDNNRASQVWAFYQSQLDTVAKVTDELKDAERPDILVLQYSTKGESVAFEVPPATWMQTQMVTLAGGNPVWLDAAQGNWTVVNLEQIAAWDPDQIYLVSYFEPVDKVMGTLRSDPTWQAMRVIQNGQLFGFPTDYYSWDQPDARWILGLRWMAASMHPDAYAGFDLSGLVYTFYEELYDIDADVVDEFIFPQLQGVIRD